MKTPKEFTFFIKKIESMDVYSNSFVTGDENIDEEKNKLYNLLMRFSFLSYLEEENILNPKKMKFEFNKDVNGKIFIFNKINYSRKFIIMRF